jgi:hypothetical protein
LSEKFFSGIKTVFYADHDGKKTQKFLSPGFEKYGSNKNKEEKMYILYSTLFIKTLNFYVTWTFLNRKKNKKLFCWPATIPETPFFWHAIRIKFPF